jgi:hypothetical protein
MGEDSLISMSIRTGVLFRRTIGIAGAAILVLCFILPSPFRGTGLCSLFHAQVSRGKQGRVPHEAAAFRSGGASYDPRVDYLLRATWRFSIEGTDRAWCKDDRDGRGHMLADWLA